MKNQKNCCTFSMIFLISILCLFSTIQCQLFESESFSSVSPFLDQNVVDIISPPQPLSIREVTTAQSSPESNAIPLTDSSPIRFTINSSQTHKYELSNIDTSKSKFVYITLNICNEPFKSTPFDLLQNQTSLSLYATSTNLTDSPMQLSQSNLGYAVLVLGDLKSSTTFIDVVAPQLPNTIKSSSWTYEIAASTKSFVESFNTTDHLYFVDSDFSSALFITSNFTTNNGVPTENITDYNIFIYPSISPTKDIRRLSHSYCGISTEGALINQDNAQLSNTTRGYDNTLKGQIYITGLNKSESYLAFLTKPSQRVVFPAVNFQAKSDTNCQMIFDLEFCSGVAFAVPGNASAFTTDELSDFYDQMAADRYGNFSKSLQNIPCNASQEIQYSLMKNCDDCANSYKQWLCGITIPRCADWSNNASFLHPRPVGKSRNPAINEVIKPGNYKEILPCADLCFDMVQDCPADFQFICPKKGRGLELSYGEYSSDGNVTCSYPGAVYFQSKSSHIGISYGLLLAMFVVSFSIL